MVHVGGPFLLIECGNPIVSRNGPPLRERHTYQLLRQLIPPGLTGALPTELDAGDVRTVFPRFTGDNARRNADLLAPIADIASVRGLSMAQIALAWLHQQAAVHGVAIVPIPGTRRAARLQENLAAVAVTLTADELVRLDSLAEQVAGDRYPDMRQTASARES